MLYSQYEWTRSKPLNLRASSRFAPAGIVLFASKFRDFGVSETGTSSLCLAGEMTVMEAGKLIRFSVEKIEPQSVDEIGIGPWPKSLRLEALSALVTSPGVY